MAAAIWFPTRNTGLSEVMGSWKIMEMSLPRIACMDFSGKSSKFSPLRRMRPSTMRPGGSGTRRMIDSAVTLLPQPLSPTMARVLPADTLKDTPSTAKASPSSVLKYVFRFSTLSRALFVSFPMGSFRVFAYLMRVSNNMSTALSPSRVLWSMASVCPAAN